MIAISYFVDGQNNSRVVSLIFCLVAVLYMELFV